MKLLWLFAVGTLCLAQNPNVPLFPNAIATDNDLLVAGNNANTVLQAGVNVSSPTITLAVWNKFVTPLSITIDNEIMRCLSNVNGVFTCQRGFNGSTPTSHSQGATVHGYIVAWPINQLSAEVKAIEGTLGANLVNVIPSSSLPAGGAPVLSSNSSRQVGAATVTGTGTTVVLNNAPVLIAPDLGTPSAAVLSNATGLPCTALPALTGDTTNTAGSCITTTTALNGGSIPSAASVVGTSGLGRLVTANGHTLAAPILCLDTTGSATLQRCATNPQFTPAPGDTILYRTTTSNTGSLQINVNGSLNAQARKWQGSSPLAAGDMVAGIYMYATYDGTYWEFYTIGNAPTGGGGGGMGCLPAGTIGNLLTDDGAGGCLSSPQAKFTSGLLSLGTPGSVTGAVTMGNTSSGTVTLQPVPGALGSAIISIPAATDTVVLLGAAQTLTNKTFASPNLGTPASGLLTNTSGLPLTTGVVGLLPLANGGLNAAITPSAGGIFYSTASGGAVLAAGSTAGLVLLSGGSGPPTWSSGGLVTGFGSPPRTGAVLLIATDVSNAVGQALGSVNTPSFAGLNATAPIVSNAVGAAHAIQQISNLFFITGAGDATFHDITINGCTGCPGGIATFNGRSTNGVTPGAVMLTAADVTSALSGNDLTRTTGTPLFNTVATTGVINGNSFQNNGGSFTVNAGGVVAMQSLAEGTGSPLTIDTAGNLSTSGSIHSGALTVSGCSGCVTLANVSAAIGQGVSTGNSPTFVGVTLGSGAFAVNPSGNLTTTGFIASTTYIQAGSPSTPNNIAIRTDGDGFTVTPNGAMQAHNLLLTDWLHAGTVGPYLYNNPSFPNTLNIGLNSSGDFSSVVSTGYFNAQFLFSVNGTNGVSCNTINPATFRSIGGIVIQC